MSTCLCVWYEDVCTCACVRHCYSCMRMCSSWEILYKHICAWIRHEKFYMSTWHCYSCMRMCVRQWNLFMRMRMHVYENVNMCTIMMFVYVYENVRTCACVWQWYSCMRFCVRRWNVVMRIFLRECAYVQDNDGRAWEYGDFTLSSVLTHVSFHVCRSFSMLIGLFCGPHFVKWDP